MIHETKNPTAKINIQHSFNPSIFKKLAAQSCVEEIENIDMDEGRFFVHLRAGYQFEPDGHAAPDDEQRTRSFDSVKEAYAAIVKAKGGAA